MKTFLSIYQLLANVGLILTKLGLFLFSGHRQTDRILESSYGNMSAHKKFQLKTQNLELAVDCYMHPGMMGMHNERQSLLGKRAALQQYLFGFSVQLLVDL